MSKIIKISLLVASLILFVGTLVFLFFKSGKKPVIYQTESPFITTIVQKTVATGSVQPRKEINLKSNVSGVVDKIYVTPGQYVQTGQLIARIRIIPNMLNLSNAESTLNRARISLEEAEREYRRYEKLYQDKLVSESEFKSFKTQWDRSKEELAAAENNLQIVKEGTRKNASTSTNLIRSTSSGMLLDVPVREGSYVIESNTFNEGTTIAMVADMNDMIFIGKVDESEVGRIREGMEVNLKIGALEDRIYQAKLEFISPKSVLEEGAIKFEIKAALQLSKDDFIRAGYSANADIIYGRKEKVLAIHESLLQFAGDSTFVEIQTTPMQFEKRLVKTGISDGIQIEMVEGVKPSDKIKVAQPTLPAEVKK
ncbi:MAG: efflux RND transporter periplasmic adaptor subunit [Cytophagaceae bacterium]|jgi:HlyD family secretion protein|nr:efflux RND transporter periplasmic adaptor subunit [Cytophagaceae bacterium]